MAPALSVVLPVRNAAKWLPALLAALAREWTTGFELIAIDDGSSDGSGGLLQKLCRHWPRERWKMVQASRQGVSAARNQGIAASNAPLIAFMDADDRPLAGRLTLPLQHLQAHPELTHVHGGWWRCNAQGEFRHPVRPWQESAGFHWRSVVEHKAVLPSAWTVRRQALLDVGGFDESLQHSEDVDLLLRLAASGYQGAWITRELVRYRIHDCNASGQLKPQLRGLLDVMEKHLKGQPASEQAWVRQQNYSTTTWAVWQAWQSGDSSHALELLSQALRDCPYPLVRRPVHLIEVFSRSSARIGVDFDRFALLASEFWTQAEPMLLCR